MSKTTIIYGSPGTGKTTRLIHIIRDFLEDGGDVQKLGFFSFSRKAAGEAMERASKSFDLDRDEMPYIRTLHSLAFYLLRLNRHNLIRGNHYKEIASAYGYHVAYVDGVLSDDCELARLITAAQRINQEVSTHYTVRRSEALQFADRYTEYKTRHGLVDFDDVINLLLENMSLLPELDLLIIDEAQDLAPSHWRIADALIKKAKNVYIAGDDDQCIYGFSGASSELFNSAKVRHNAAVEVLETSHRLPEKIWDLANKIIKKVVDRQEKTWNPRDAEGFAAKVADIRLIDLEQDKDILILGRTKKVVAEAEKHAQQKGLIYEGLAGKSGISDDVVYAIIAHIKWQQGHFTTKKEHSAHKKHLPELEQKKSVKELIKKPWQTYFLLPRNDLEEYYTKLIRRYEAGTVNQNKIKFSTIHAAKGGEAQHVILLLEMGKISFDRYARGDDNERRVFYVGATRAKNKLTLVNAMATCFAG